MINDANADRSRTANFPEFLSVMAKKSNADSEEDIKEALKIFDRDGNRYVSTFELRHIMSKLSRRPLCFPRAIVLTGITYTINGQDLTNKVDEVIHQANVDGDGRVNYRGFMEVTPLRSSTRHGYLTKLSSILQIMTLK